MQCWQASCTVPLQPTICVVSFFSRNASSSAASWKQLLVQCIEAVLRLLNTKAPYSDAHTTHALIRGVGVELAVDVPLYQAGLATILLPQEHNLQIHLASHRLARLESPNGASSAILPKAIQYHYQCLRLFARSPHPQEVNWSDVTALGETADLHVINRN